MESQHLRLILSNRFWWNQSSVYLNRNRIQLNQQPCLLVTTRNKGTLEIPPSEKHNLLGMQSHFWSYFLRLVALSSRSFSHYIIVDDLFFIAHHHSLRKRFILLTFQQWISNVNVIDQIHLDQFMEHSNIDGKHIPVGGNGFPR